MGTRQAGVGKYVVAAAAIAAVVGLGIVLRLVDPLSSPALPAEDPFTHMALVREHLRTGHLEPLNSQGDLYPPGLHGFLAAVWVYTGVDLHEIFRIGPVILGAIGIIGIALLLGRSEGLIAAFVGALALAVAPEEIFRTTMMSPTALDLAVLPVLLYALVRGLSGELAWMGVAAPIMIFIVFSHPWLLAIIAAAGLAYVLVATLFPWPSSRSGPLSPRAVVAGVAIVGAALGLSFTTCDGQCGPGFRDLKGLPFVGVLDVLAPVAILLALGLAALVVFAPTRITRVVPRFPSRPLPWWGRLAASILLVGAFFAMTINALDAGLPEYVDLPRMFGLPILVLAALALFALPFASSPAGVAGAGIVLTTYPLVVFNPLHSAFLPHRTAVFLGIGLVLLAGSAAASLARLASKLPAAVPRFTRTMRPALLAIPSLLMVSVLGATVYAATPDGYPEGWYRLYPGCEYDALREVATMATSAPNALVITGVWESKLVLVALADGAERIWYKPDFFSSYAEQGGLLLAMAKSGRPVYVVVDRHLAEQGLDTRFLLESPWRLVDSWCSAAGVDHPRVLLYVSDPVIA